MMRIPISGSRTASRIAASVSSAILHGPALHAGELEAAHVSGSAMQK